MRVLVVGGGGREHALVWKLSQSPHLTELFCAPGNAGTEQCATNVDVNPANLGALALWALEQQIDLTVVGPEAPLADGIVDVFTDHGLRIFGPTKAAARLEASKSFAKSIMLESKVETARGEVFSDLASAVKYVRSHGTPIVVKADGLAAGKGVTVAATEAEAVQALEICFVERKFGDSGATVVVEACVPGKEASVMALVQGDTVLPLVISQDYKRLSNGDQGPNTGGMGAISPTPVLSDNRLESLVEEIFVPVVRTLAAKGIPYCGFLYAGVMVDNSGKTKVLEFNCRLGDPETQVLLMRLESDLLEALDAAARGKLETVDLQWSKEAAACVVASSRGYPEKVDDGKQISGLFNGDEKLRVFHAGTTSQVGQNGDSRIVSCGGRILTVAALGTSVEAAVNRAYDGLRKISFDGMHYRTDIGRVELLAPKI